MFAASRQPALICDPGTSQHEDEHCAYKTLQERQPIGKPARDEQSADKPCQNDHRPVLKALDQDQADDAAQNCKDQTKKWGIHIKETQESQHDCRTRERTQHHENNVHDPFCEPGEHVRRALQASRE